MTTMQIMTMSLAMTTSLALTMDIEIPAIALIPKPIHSAITITQMLLPVAERVFKRLQVTELVLS